MASAARPQRTPSASATAAEVPTSTGATAAPNVRGRAPCTHNDADVMPTSGPLRELVERRLALLEVGALALLGLFTHVVEEGGVAGELLDPGETVVGRVARRLDHAERERAVLQHLPAPCHGLLLQPLERHDGVDQAHVEGLLRVVLAAQEPDLARLLLPARGRQAPRPVPAVERPDARTGLPEAGVVGGDGEVAHHVEHVPATDRVARDHGDDRL